MNELTLAEARSELHLRREIDARLDQIGALGQKLVDDKLFGAQNHNGQLQPTQLRNAIAVANETSSLEVLKNWIRYQIGRADGRGWRHERFGEGVIEQIDGPLQALAAEVATGAGASDRQHEVWTQLTRLYLGYLNRHFYYRNEEQRRAAPARPAPAARPAAGGRPGGAPPSRPGGQPRSPQPAPSARGEAAAEPHAPTTPAPTPAAPTPPAPPAGTPAPAAAGGPHAAPSAAVPPASAA